MKNSLSKVFKAQLDLMRRHKYTEVTKEQSEALLEEALMNMGTPYMTKGIAVKDPFIVPINNIECTVYTLFNPYAVMLHGYKCATCVTDTVNQIVILVDDSYMKLTKGARDFVQWHELGHIEQNHVFNKRSPLKRLINILRGITEDNEINADKYALSMMGNYKSFSALMELSFLCRGLARKELRRRAKIIKDLA